jgi:nitroreductase
LNVQDRERERPLGEAIAERRATPSFDGSPVPGEVLEKVIRAGVEAPRGFNLQPRFVGLAPHQLI